MRHFAASAPATTFAATFTPAVGCAVQNQYDTMFQLAEMVRPRLVEDGMFLVGLDIVGDKLMEINVFSPGGLGSARSLKK